LTRAVRQLQSYAQPCVVEKQALSAASKSAGEHSQQAGSLSVRSGYCLIYTGAIPQHDIGLPAEPVIRLSNRPVSPPALSAI
jgi:hypothetical protein